MISFRPTTPTKKVGIVERKRSIAKCCGNCGAESYHCQILWGPWGPANPIKTKFDYYELSSAQTQSNQPMAHQAYVVNTLESFERPTTSHVKQAKLGRVQNELFALFVSCLPSCEGEDWDRRTMRGTARTKHRKQPQVCFLEAGLDPIPQVLFHVFIIPSVFSSVSRTTTIQ